MVEVIKWIIDLGVVVGVVTLILILWSSNE